MLKRTLPLLLLLALACAAGCKPETETSNTNSNTNRNAGANVGNRQTDANANANIGVNANANANTDNSVAPVLHAREDRSVAIFISEDGSGKLQISVSPEDIKLLKPKNQRLRFHVFNNTDVDLREVVITFVTENPMDGDFKIGDIKAGNDKNSVTRRIRGDAAAGKYTYGLKAFGNTSADPVAVMNSPEVEIAT